MSDEFLDRISPIPGLLANPDDADAREFYDAALEGDLDRLKAVLMRAPSIDINAQHRQIPDGNGFDPVEWDEGTSWTIEASEAAINGAARRGHVDVVCMLLALGADVNSECTHDNELRTPLHSAIESNNINLVRLLLDHGADLNLMFFDAALGEDLSYRHVCFTTRDLDILDLLLDRGGFDINQIGELGRPIREEDYASRPTSYHKHLLFQATFAYHAVQGGVEMIRWAIRRGLNASNRLLEAVNPGDYETMRYLVLDLGLKDTDFLPLSRVQMWRTSKDVSLDQCLPSIRLLLGTLSQDRIKQLPDVLCEAVEGQLEDVSQFWLDWGVDINGYSALGLTPLHQAIVSRNRVEFVEMILERGADVNRRTINPNPGRGYSGGSNSLHIAYSIGNRSPGVIEALVAAGVDREARDISGSTPLHKLAEFIGAETHRWNEAEEAVRILRSHTKGLENINATDRQGKTALHCVASAKTDPKYQKEAAMILVQRGVDPNIKDNDGMTAKDRFRHVHNIDLEDWIEESLCDTVGQVLASGS